VLKPDEPFRYQGIFIISFFQQFRFGLLQFLVDISRLMDPDPGSQTLANPTDPDPKHWIMDILRRSCLVVSKMIKGSTDQGIKHFHQTEKCLHWISRTSLRLTILCT